MKKYKDDIEKYEDGSYQEGSKQLKGLKQEDVEALKTFASANASDHTSAFLSGPTGGDGGKISGTSAAAPAATASLNIGNLDSPSLASWLTSRLA